MVHGDGTNRSLLLEEGLKTADAFLCLTGIDEENIVLSLFAKSVNKDIKTITKVNHTLFREVIKTLDIDSVVYPKFTTASIILRHVRSKASRHGENHSGKGYDGQPGKRSRPEGKRKCPSENRSGIRRHARQAAGLQRKRSFLVRTLHRRG